MKLDTFLVTLFAAYAAAKVGDSCHDSNGFYGTCEDVGWCNNHSGDSSTRGLCPNDPSSVRCCFYPTCNDITGYCMKTNDPQCNSGGFRSGHCPGGSNYQCCVSWSKSAEALSKFPQLELEPEPAVNA